jgi:hypothetical protein
MKGTGKSHPYFAMNAWRRMCGMKEDIPTPTLTTYEDSDKNWSETFIKLMKNRMKMGAFRYGVMKTPGRPKYDTISSIRKRLNNYEKSGNQENLVDIANICMTEFAENWHPKAHFASVDDGEHAQIKK